MFILLTTAHGDKLRSNVTKLETYYSTDPNNTNGGTTLTLTGHKFSILVKETVEEIDTMLREMYVTVKEPTVSPHEQLRNS